MVLFIIAIVVVFGPWVFAEFNRQRIGRNEEEIARLRVKLERHLTALEYQRKQQSEATPEKATEKPAEKPPQGASPPETAPAPPAAPSPWDAQPLPPETAVPPAAPLPPSDAVWEDETPEAFAGEHHVWEDEPAPKQTHTRRAKTAIHMAAAQVSAKRPDKRQEDSFEFRFGKSLPVWIGGIALALSGFFLVKYSIEKGLLTDTIRVALGFVFGLALLGGGGFIRARRPDMADGERIAQALTGAGIAVLYGTFCAATKFYGMPRPVGFGGMVGVTLLAVLLSLRHGMPIAALGMLGGFATPALLSNGSHDSFGLFGYLFLLCAGLFALIRSRNWWVLALPALLISFFWTLGWILSVHVHESGPWPGLFLLALAATALLSSETPSPADAPAEREEEADERDWNLISGYLAAGGAMALMAMLTVRAGFTALDWGMYAALGAGSLLLSWFKPAQYRHAPWASMAITVLMIFSWEDANPHHLALTIAGFGLMYAAGAFFFLRRNPSLEHGLTLSAAAIGFYGLGYARLHGDIYELFHLRAPAETPPGFIVAPHFWSALAFALALGFTLLTASALRRHEGEPDLRDRLAALFSLMTTAFLSIAMLIEVHRDFLPVAFAAELLAVSWVAAKIAIPFLRRIAAILLGVFGLLLLPQVVVLTAVAINSLFGVSFERSMIPPLAAHPLFQLGIPMLLLGASTLFLRRRGDDRLVETVEISAVALGALLLYYLSRHVFHMPDEILFRKADFFERGVITNLFFAAGLGVIWMGRFWSRRALLWSASALFAMALFRSFYFDFLLLSPLWSNETVGGGIIFNALLVTYGLPLVWLWLEEKPALRIAVMPGAKGAATLLYLFTLVTLEVRQGFGGASLRLGRHMHNAEIYSYSAAWLVMGALMLLAGTLRRHKPLRVAALVLMMLTVCKVFLYDAGELEGLYRVFAFMGLGLSLMGLSWFYTRFVLDDGAKDTDKGE
ncbi:MAG: DUF2339 domain-containing protein [Alphaproteobacteria bacterium]|nr:DUF2339 domain-containing protein [Alphaproteobacteria bacterium]